MPQFLTDEEMQKLEEGSVISDEEMDRLEREAMPRSMEQKALEGMRSTGRSIAEGAATVSRGLESVTSAPMRAYVGAMVEGKDPAKAFGAQFAKDPRGAPTGDELLGKMGVPSGPEIELPVQTNLRGEKLKVTPRGVAGGVAEMALDPTTYIPGPAAFKATGAAAKGVSGMSPKVAKYLSNIAEERAVKAATGENAAAIRKLARVKGQSAGDVDKALANLRRSGRHLLEPGPGGADPAVGFFSKSEDIAEAAAERRKALGKEIGDIGTSVDQIAPNAVSGPDLAKQLRDYAASIPAVGKGGALKDRLEKEALQLEAMGPMSFEQAQKVKNQFPFEPQSADALISDKDVTNKIQGIVGGGMDKAVADAGALQMGPLKPGDDLASRYGAAKERYGTFKNIADAGTEQKLREIRRRFVSPSDYGVGGAAAVTSAVAQGGAGFATGLAAVAAAGANKLARERGSAVAARSLDALAKVAASAPETIAKYQKYLQGAAAAGPTALVARHHILMNNDPEYRALFQDEGTK